MKKKKFNDKIIKPDLVSCNYKSYRIPLRYRIFGKRVTTHDRTDGVDIYKHFRKIGHNKYVYKVSKCTTVQLDFK